MNEKNLRAKVLIGNDTETGEMVEHPVSSLGSVYVYSEVPFHVWFKLKEEWIRATEKECRLGIAAECPQGSTHYWVETTQQDQIVIGFDDVSESFAIDEPDFW